MKEVYVVSYFYPDGTYAGIIGVYADPVGAHNATYIHSHTNYPDCTFIVTRAEVE